MRNAGLDEAQAGIKMAGRNNNNLRYTNDITLMAESKEELKSLLMKMKVLQSWAEPLPPTLKLIAPQAGLQGALEDIEELSGHL